MSESPDRAATVYHIAEARAWPGAEGAGAYAGGAACRADGFIHFSTWDQLPGTLARFFPGRDGLILLAAEPGRLGAALRWEPVGGEVFPHLYGMLPVACARVLGPIRLGGDGRHVLPSRSGPPEADTP